MADTSLSSGVSRGSGEITSASSSSLTRKKNTIRIQCYVKGRPPPHDVNRTFASVLAQEAGERARVWSFFAESPQSRRAHLDIFPVQVRVEIAADIDDGTLQQDFQNLRKISLQAAERLFLRRVLFLRLSWQDSVSRKITAKYLPVTPAGAYHGDKEDPATASTWADAVGEGVVAVLLPAVAISCAVYYGLQLLYGKSEKTEATGNMSANTPATQDIPGNTPKKQKTQETPKSIPESISEQLKDENGRSAVKKAMEDIRNLVESVRNQFCSDIQQAGSASEAKAELEASHETTELHFQKLIDKLGVPNKRVETESPGSSQAVSDAFPITTEDALEIAGLSMALANAQLRQKEALKQFFPFHKKQYSGKKLAVHAIITVGAVVTVAAAAASAAGLIPVFGTIGWLTGYTAAATGAGGLAASVVSGSRAKANYDEYPKRKQVRVTEEVVRMSRNKFLCCLTAHVIGQQNFSFLSPEEKRAIYRDMGGLQPDLLNEKKYTEAALHTVWEEFYGAIREHQEAVGKLVT